jgi:hypothetical protein
VTSLGPDPGLRPWHRPWSAPGQQVAWTGPVRIAHHQDTHAIGHAPLSPRFRGNMKGDTRQTTGEVDQATTHRYSRAVTTGTRAPVPQPSCATADDVPAASDRPVYTGNLRSLMDNLMGRLTCE